MRTYNGPVAGIDEAGRGPWAGPVVAAAVILDIKDIPDGVDDSKKLTAEVREALFDQIMERAVVGIGIGDVARIDSDNILHATLWAMSEACRALPDPPSAVLIDGNRCPDGLPCPAQPLIKGDTLSLTVAAASIVAKVTRDRIMTELAATHPAYGWENNKGYGTPSHAQAIARHGVTAHHRRSFKPIQKFLTETAPRKAG